LFIFPDLEGGLEFLKYAMNIEKASTMYLSPVQKGHVKRKWLDLEANIITFPKDVNQTFFGFCIKCT
jgi:hypothetical protein